MNYINQINDFWAKFNLLPDGKPYHINLYFEIGTGKTMMMQIFKKYCDATHCERHYNMADVREVNNYFRKERNVQRDSGFRKK